MKIGASASKWGYAIIGIAAIVFLGYWYLLLEPIQGAFLESGKNPSWVVFGLFGIVVGAMSGLLTFAGGALTKGKFFGIEYEASILDLFDEINTWKWVAAWAFCFFIMTMIWRISEF
jgi:hypothetical protein